MEAAPPLSMGASIALQRGLRAADTRSMTIVIRRPGSVALTLCIVFCLMSCNRGEGTPTSPSFSEGITIAIQNEPCIAPATGGMSCSFVATPQFGEQDLRFNWRIENPANGRASVGPPGPQINPTLTCDFSSGIARFEVLVKLIVWRAGLPEDTETVTRTATITRAAGACGT